MTDSPALVIRTLLENLRDACLNAYTIPGAPLPVPSPVIAPNGPSPTIDCADLLIVQCVDVTSAFQGPPEACALVMKCSLQVTVTRCVPNLDSFGRPKDRAELTAAGESLADDASTLWAGVTGQCVAGTLWSGFYELGCQDTSFRDMRPASQGGIGWWTWSIVVTVAAPLLAGQDQLVWESGDAILWES